MLIVFYFLLYSLSFEMLYAALTAKSALERINELNSTWRQVEFKPLMIEYFIII